jgi:N-acetylmuramic acid 6-phosphate etherase
LPTEPTRREDSPLDLLPTSDAVAAIFEGQLAAAAAVEPRIEAIARAAEEATGRLENPTGRLVYVGAGTSGRLAVLDGAELEPTFGWSPDRIAYGIAGGLAALSRSIENAEDDEEAGRQFVRSAALNRNDVVIAVSASGSTAFTVGAVAEAFARGALTIAIFSTADTPLLLAASHPIFLDTGAELVSGSTRMKAGTAQKIVLGMLSTTIMLGLGRVHDGLMVDMRVSNRKLRARAIGIVAQISGADRRAAEAALDLADNNIKLATLVAMGQSAEDARRFLAESRDNLRSALTRLGKPPY